MKYQVFLPKTDFPMKADLANKEPQILEKWQHIYELIRQKSHGRKKFVLHWGPPYANGRIHIGHALNVILKDIINKNYQMSGYDAVLVPGWDCHGLPIEWEIEKRYREQSKTKNLTEFRKECRDFAQYWLEEQRKEFIRLGVVADFANPYDTMNFASEAAIVSELHQMVKGGHVYRGLRPVMWSVVEQTALAEAEIEYKDKESDSIYVAFPVLGDENTKVLIWTTTPWSLPANRAICYGDFNYVIARKGSDRFIIAEDLYESLATKLSLDANPTLISTEELSKIKAKHPFYDFTVPLLYGEHVTVDSGTGLVHTAPCHGLEDFGIGIKNQLEIPETVANDGHYTKQAGTSLEGIHVFKAHTKIFELLADSLIHKEKIQHSYPHSWRSKAPLIFRTTPQWFVKLDPEIRTRALAAMENVKWIPKEGETRLSSMLKNRPDWCISRQRSWGTPMALFVHKNSNEILRDEAVNQRILKAIELHGSDIWYQEDSKVFLGDHYDPSDYEKITDTLDVWIDSGATQAFVLKKRNDLTWPADLYLEGSDQHRGWFQSSLLLSIANTGVAPYKAVLTHGFVLDSNGYKMSKSQGNVIAPCDVIEKYGADVLRLWVANVYWQDDVRIGMDMLQNIQEMYRKFRNTMRYLLGSLRDFDAKEILEYKDLPELERWVLHRIDELSTMQKQVLKDFKILEFYDAIYQFCNNDLSAFYFDIRKDILYCDHLQSTKRRAVCTTLHYVFEFLVRILAPVLSFTAEEAWQSRGNSDSIHGKEFLACPKEWHNVLLSEYIAKLRDVRKSITIALEEARNAKKINANLEAKITLHTSYAHLPQDILLELCIVSDLEIIQNGENKIMVEAAAGNKCPRCWKITPAESLCNRCAMV